MTALRRLILLLGAAGLARAWARRRAEPRLPALPPGPPVDAVVEDPEPAPVAAVPEPEPEPEAVAEVEPVAEPEPPPAEVASLAPPPAPEPEPPPPAAGPPPPEPPPPPSEWRPPVPDPQPRLKPLNPEAAVAPVEFPTMEMDSLALPQEEGEPRVSAMPPTVGNPIDLAPEGDVIVTAITHVPSVSDAVETGLDEHATAPDTEDYAYAAGLMEPPVESAEPDVWQSDEPAPPETSADTEESPAQEPPKAAADADSVDIVTVVDDLLDRPD
jgi:hypothetical protein